MVKGSFNYNTFLFLPKYTSFNGTTLNFGSDQHL